MPVVYNRKQNPLFRSCFMRHFFSPVKNRAISVIAVFLFALVFFSSCASSEARAARRGDLGAVQEFVEQGGDVNERQKGGMTLLMYASAGGQVPTIDYLASVGADIHMKDDGGLTALIHGASSGQNGSVNALISYGADVNAVTNAGQSSLLIGASKDYSAIVQTLLASGADYTKMDNAGWTPVLMALKKSAADPSGINQSAMLLFEAGAGFRINEKPVNSIAFTAAESGNRDVLQLLLDQGLNPGITDSNGNTLLHRSTLHFEMTIFLMDLGLNPNSMNSRGETPLTKAVQNGSLQAVKALLARGASTEIPDKDRKTPLLHAAQSKNVEILRTLLMSGANPYIADSAGNSALHLASAGGDVESARLLLTAGIFVDARNLTGQTAYDMSFNNQQYGEQIRQLLISAGAAVPQDAAQTAKVQSVPGPAASPETSPAPSASNPVKTPGSAVSTPPSASSPVPAATRPSPDTPSAEKEKAASPQEPVQPEVPREPAAPADETPAVPVQTDSPAVETPVIPSVPDIPAVQSYSVRFSWSKITPSRAAGWNNSDKITDQATLTLQYSDSGSPLLSQRVTIPLKGVNADAFYLDKRVDLETGKSVTGTVSIRTTRGGMLTGSVRAAAESGNSLVLVFDAFEYKK